MGHQPIFGPYVKPLSFLDQKSLCRPTISIFPPPQRPPSSPLSPASLPVFASSPASPGHADPACLQALAAPPPPRGRPASEVAAPVRPSPSLTYLGSRGRELLCTGGVRANDAAGDRPPARLSPLLFQFSVGVVFGNQLPSFTGVWDGEGI
jgi:hypothetical protein